MVEWLIGEMVEWLIGDWLNG